MGARQKAALRDRALAPEVARVLLVEDNVAVRLTLQAVLEASGYSVDSAASAAEAMDKIEREQYALVLCDLSSEARDESHQVIRYARAQEYKPATAILTASGLKPGQGRKGPQSERLLIEPLEVPALLTKIADLLADRAAGRARRNIRRRHADVVAAN